MISDLVSTGEKPCVVALHCSLGSGRQWYKLARELGPLYQVIAPDIAGYGDNRGWLELPITLAEEISATVTMPPWSNASMDGYAVRSADITAVMAHEPVKLRVVGTIAAGEFASRPLKRGEAMRIMTGAPIPEGAR